MPDRMSDEDDDAFGADSRTEPSTAVAGDARALSTYYGSADEWFRRYWRYTYRRRVSPRGTGTGRWAADWWNNDEATQRIEALWRAWEASRQDPGFGMSTWWLNHADPHMNALLAPDGPFAATSDENQPGELLPYRERPAGRFPADRYAESP